MDLLPALTETWQSGEALARRLGKTRQAVAKAASRLAAEGFPIERGKQGYRLAPGTPAPQNLGPRLKGRFGRPYRYLGTVTSTQDELRNLAEAGAPEGAVVLAEVQTAGRGRRGRRWESPGSGLYFSLLLRPRSPLSALALLPLAAGVALARAAGVGGLKWPNDLVVPLSSEGESAWAKLGGILLEADILGEEIRYALLGVGLNVAEAGLPQGAAGLARFFPVCVATCFSPGCSSSSSAPMPCSTIPRPCSRPTRSTASPSRAGSRCGGWAAWSRGWPRPSSPTARSRCARGGGDGW